MDLQFRQFYWRWLKNLFILFFIVLGGLTLFRLGFTLYFGDWQTLQDNFSTVRYAFFLGLRYDLMPIAYINALPFLILHLAYFLRGQLAIKVVRWSILSILTFGYILLLWLYVMDYSFYSYFQDHLNILFFGLFEDDTLALFQSIWKNYNVPLWLILIAISHYGTYRLVKVMFSLFDFDLKPRRNFLLVLVSFLCGLTFLAFSARGTFTRLPLSVEDAYFSPNEFINEISLNGVITLNRALKIRKVFGRGEYNYLASYGFSNWQDAYEAAFGKKPGSEDLIQALTVRTPHRPELEERPAHVVMIVMESFGSYWNDQHVSDFNLLGSLEKHFKKGILFENFLPAENGTIGSMVSIATSQVIRPGARFLSESEFMSTPLASAVNLPFKNKGYDTHFVYGGKLGWRDLGKYLRHQGYDRMWGADEIKEALPELANFDSRDLGNEWGIFDEYLYLFIEEQLRTASTPQFFLVLTTTNHPPFEYPSTYRPLPLELNSEKLSQLTIGKNLAEKRFLSLQYANQKAGEFLDRLAASVVRDNVVVGITGDHSYWVKKNVELAEEFKRFSVPFFISVPERLKPSRVNTSRFGSHEDIFPSLYHLTLSNQKYIGLGDNLFGSDSFAMNSFGLVASEQGAYHHEKYWMWKDKKKQLLEETEATDELLQLRRKAQGLIAITDLYLKSEKNRKQSAANNDQQ